MFCLLQRKLCLSLSLIYIYYVYHNEIIVCSITNLSVSFEWIYKSFNEEPLGMVCFKKKVSGAHRPYTYSTTNRKIMKLLSQLTG
jgi:hypothetical protein